MEETTGKKPFEEKAKEWYSKKYKLLLIIPLIVLVVSLIIIVGHYNKTNEIFEKDVSLKGGTTATVYSSEQISITEVQDFLLSKFSGVSGADISVRKLTEFGSDKQIGISIEASNIDATELKKSLEEKLGIELTMENFSLEEVGSSLGESFYQQMLWAMVAAFVLMAIVVFFIFKSLAPSLMVVLSAFADIVGPIAVLDLMNFKISSAGISALLLLIGYSVDTDMLLTTRVLKRNEGNVVDRIFSSFLTGIMMSLTSFSAVVVGYFVANSPVLKEVFLIISIGLIFDIFNTWLTNTGLIMWYMERKNAAKKVPNI